MAKVELGKWYILKRGCDQGEPVLQMGHPWCGTQVRVVEKTRDGWWVCAEDGCYTVAYNDELEA